MRGDDNHSGRWLYIDDMYLVRYVSLLFDVVNNQ